MLDIVLVTPKFYPRTFVITDTVMRKLGQTDVAVALIRHLSGDWGDLNPTDWEKNDVSLREGSGLFSVYHATDGTEFVVFTEHDRSATTVLLQCD
jgi:hypothetical protein